MDQDLTGRYGDPVATQGPLPRSFYGGASSEISRESPKGYYAAGAPRTRHRTEDQGLKPSKQKRRKSTTGQEDKSTREGSTPAVKGSKPVSVVERQACRRGLDGLGGGHGHRGFSCPARRSLESPSPLTVYLPLLRVERPPRSDWARARLLRLHLVVAGAAVHREGGISNVAYARGFPGYAGPAL